MQKIYQNRGQTYFCSDYINFNFAYVSDDSKKIENKNWKQKLKKKSWNFFCVFKIFKRSVAPPPGHGPLSD